MRQPDPQAVKACERLLNTPASAPEDTVRQNISRLLDLLDVECLFSYATDDGPADIYLPRRRIFFETKRAGGAVNPDSVDASTGESPRQQLERYLRSEIASELDQFDFQDEGERSRTWVGILTDGRVWHAWRYAHEEGSVGETIFTGLRPANGEELLGRVQGLLAAGPVGKPWIPSDPSPIFQGHLDSLREVRTGLAGRSRQIVETQMELWLDMLRTSAMAPEDQHARFELFLRHSFLVALARSVIHTLARPNQAPDPRTFLADGFVSWVQQGAAGRQWASDLANAVHGYEWRRRRGDVLKPVYENFVGEADRKIFGEYYTPDWLAGMLVEEVLDDEWCEHAVTAALMAETDPPLLDGVGVLDPACGSGTFLYHAALRLARTPTLQDAALPPVRKAGAVVRLLNGIDIHPIAAEISRASILRALPAEPPGGAASVRVFQGDALLAQPRDELSLFTHSADQFRFDTPRGGELYLPRSFARTRNFTSDMRRVTESAVANAGRSEDDPGFRPLAADILATVEGDDRDTLAEFHRALSRVIDDEGNGVWGWYMTNITGPVRLAERKVNRIVANPPWVTMSDIQVETRKTTLEEFAKEQAIDLWAGGRQGPHLDIAQLFVKRTRALYLQRPDDDPAAWVVKKAALKGGNWQRFRRWWWGTIGAQTLDLEALRPFGGGDARRCCVLLDVRRCRNATVLDATALVVDRAPNAGFNAASPEMPTSRVLPGLRFREAPAPLPVAPSAYDGGHFRQGATITPRVLAFVERFDEQDGMARVVTDRSSKTPWKEIDPQMGEVPRAWLRRVHKSRDVLAFLVAPTAAYAIIPLGNDGILVEDPGVRCPLWADLDVLYREHAGRGASTPRTLLTQFDFASKLSAQLPPRVDTAGRLVLYPKSGDIMRAARVLEAETLAGDCLYWWVARSEAEASYLVALLNADALQHAFVEAQESGRDFHLHPWRKVPVPRFSDRIDLHRTLAALCGEAEGVATRWVEQASERDLRLDQVARSRRIRAAVREAGVMARINDAARRLLPDHVSETGA